MSEQPSDRIGAMLARLAEMDLSAAEHVHEQLVAATEPDAVASLARAYARLSRSGRQVLMLSMKHDRERAEAAERAAQAAEPSVLDQPSAYERLVDGRIEELQDAIGRIAAVTHPDSPKRQREALDRLDVELDEWPDDHDFITERLHALVAEACRRVDLPATLADTWEDLPRPPNPFDPATNPARPPPAASPPVPKADTG